MTTQDRVLQAMLLLTVIQVIRLVSIRRPHLEWRRLRSQFRIQK